MDSVVQLSNDRSLADLLLNYLDMTIHSNIYEKTHILMELHKYIEPKKSKLKDSNLELTNRVFSMYNKLHVRHNDNKQIELPDDEKLKWYDILFQMTLHLIRSSYIEELQNEVKVLVSGE